MENIEELKKASEKDPISFWKSLKTSTDNLDFNETKNMPAEDEWLAYFETLHSEHKLGDEQEEILECLKNYEKTNDQFNKLDGTITDTDLLNAAKNMKLKKAAYSDKIKNEMIKSSTGILLKGYLKVFNAILISGHFPESWCEGIITPIFKSGNSLDPSNYRGICVSSCMGKLFCSILNTRLACYTKEKKSIHPTQIGFISRNRTADHILTLKTLHDKYVKQSENGKIYACFVDLKKAFDSIWHKGLYLKLLENEIGGRFYELIKNMYSKTKCTIKLSDYRTSFFQYKKGVRQSYIQLAFLVHF